jgi:hypothetical protein
MATPEPTVGAPPQPRSILISLNAEESQLLEQAMEIELPNRPGQRLTRTSLARIFLMERCSQIVEAGNGTK